MCEAARWCIRHNIAQGKALTRFLECTEWFTVIILDIEEFFSVLLKILKDDSLGLNFK